MKKKSNFHKSPLHRLLTGIAACLVLLLIFTAVFFIKNARDFAQNTFEVTASSEDCSPGEAFLKEESVVDELFPLEYLEEVVSTLTSEQADGRLPGTKGNDIATQFIRDEMVKSGLEAPGFTEDYLMDFELIQPLKQSVTTMVLREGDTVRNFSFGTDFIEFVMRDFAKGIGAYEGGFSIIDDPFNLYDFEGLDNPEIVVYTKNAISGVSYETLFAEILNASKPPKVVLYESDQQNSGYFIISPFSKAMTANDNQNGLLIYKISDKVLKALQENPKAMLCVKTDVIVESVEVSNVIGMIDGTGDEGLVISAHFDHLGNNFDGSYNPGALDNASGTTVMLSLAKALEAHADPKMDYYFIAFNGEEEGLYGSEAFSTANGLDKEKFKFINIDMVGSSSDEFLEISATALQSKFFQKEALAYGQLMGMKVLESSKGSSDHESLENAGYVSISLTELDKRFYHSPNDTIENGLDFDKMQNIAYFIYNFVFEQDNIDYNNRE